MSRQDGCRRRLSGGERRKAEHRRRVILGVWSHSLGNLVSALVDRGLMVVLGQSPRRHQPSTDETCLER